MGEGTAGRAEGLTPMVAGADPAGRQGPADTRTERNQSNQEGIKMKLTAVEGIGASYAEKLQGAGISTTGALLKSGATPKGRQMIAERSGISPKLILEWVNHVDLFRVKGVGEEYADLLEESGVDTVPELAQRNPANLHQSMLAVNKQKKLVRRLPTESQVRGWVEQARQLPRVVTY
jgi:predicted flap endonuclease-1-like 5' DNA nuclease